MSLFLFLSSTSLGQHYQKSPAKSRGFGKNIIRSDGPIGGGGGCVKKGGLNLLHTTILRG